MIIDILTCVLVVITAFYAWVTYRMSRANDRVVRLMEEQLYASNRPYMNISVTSEPGSPLFMLRIKNTGKAGAEDLRLTLDRSFQQFGNPGENRDLSTFNAFRFPIASFPPDAEFLFYLAQSFVVFGQEADPSRTPPVFSVRAQYRYAGREIDESTTIDLRPHLMTVSPAPQWKESLKRIEEVIDKLVSAVSELGKKSAQQTPKADRAG